MSTDLSHRDVESADSKETSTVMSGDDLAYTNRATTNSGSHHAIAVVALVIGLIALAGSGFVWYSTAVTGRLELTETLTRAEVIAQGFDALRSAQQISVTEQNTLRRQIEGDRRAVEDKLRILDEKTRAAYSGLGERQDDANRELKAEFDMLVRSMESTRLQLGRGTDDWLLEEISQLLSLANERLILIGDAPLALRAMELAQERLAELFDPALLMVQQQLVTDIAILAAIPRPDIDMIALRLSILIQQVSNLPLAGDVLVSGFTETAKEVSKPSAMDNTLTGLGRRLIEDFGTLVRIRNIETTQLPNLAPDQRFLVYESLRSSLNAAQLALLRGLPALYRSSVSRAQAALTRGFDETSTEVIAFHSAIEQLATVELTNEYPDISKAFGMLREIIQNRSRGATE